MSSTLCVTAAYLSMRRKVILSRMFASLHRRLSRRIADAGVNDERMEHAHAATQNLEFESERLEDALEKVRESGSINALTSLARAMARENKRKPE